MTNLDEQLAAWRDKVVGQRRAFTVGMIDPLWSQRYAAAIDDLNPLYFDRAYAVQHGYRDMLAPPNYLTTMRDDATYGPVESAMQEDGLPGKSGPDVPGLAAMGGGQEIEFHDPVYCGERIVGDKGVIRVEQQTTRSGQMVVVVEEIQYRNDANERKVTLRNTVLYRVLAREAP